MTTGPALGFLRPAAALCAFALGSLPAAPVAAQPADAAPRVQTVSEFVRIADAFATVDAVLHRPAGAQPAVGLVYTHPFAQSSLSGYVCDALPRRGFAVLCFNNRLSNNQQFNSIWEPIALDVAAAVSEMRRRGYARVVLIGLSAGGPTMAYYQDVAENGNAVFRDGTTLSGFRGFFGRDGAERRLPPADGVILTNPSSGIGASGLLRLDPSVVDEQTGRRDPSLDMYEAANGYDAATGTARYAPAFLARFRAAQCDRMNRLIEATRARQAAVRAGTARFADDDVAVNPGLRANPAYVDLSLARTTREPRVVLPGGATMIVANDRTASDQRVRNRGHDETARTDSSFLSYRAIRCRGLDADATDAGAHGLDAASNNNTTYRHVAGIGVPLLVMQGTGDNTIVHLTVAELIHDAASRTPDRTLWYVRGATHVMTALRPEFGDVPGIVADALAGWLRERYR
jgi:alpha-beta hydrolase superfamily lysophospholipase